MSEQKTRIEITGNIVVHHPVKEPITEQEAYLNFLEAGERPRTREERAQWKRQFLCHWNTEAA
jgi:hypothetical protein